MKRALKFMSQKKLGVLVARNSKNRTTGVIVDGQIRRKSEKENSTDEGKGCYDKKSSIY